MSQDNQIIAQGEQRGLSIGASSEAARSQAEIQAALVIAKANPRDEMRSIAKIEQSCQRMSLAKRSEYRYERGGTEIVGASVDLLRVIAGYWGNVQYGFRILNSTDDMSECEAYAWDVETNVKKVLPFKVRHVRTTRKGSYKLKDDRDIYELVANFGARRERSCLEGVIPKDVIEDAVGVCRKTVAQTWEVTTERIKKALAELKKHGVTRADVERKYQRKIESIVPMQLVQLRDIIDSMEAGISVAEDHFSRDEPDDAKEPAKASKPEPKRSMTQKIKEEAEAREREQIKSDVDKATKGDDRTKPKAKPAKEDKEETVTRAQEVLAKIATLTDPSFIARTVDNAADDDEINGDEFKEIEEAATERLAEIEGVK